jgi:hypothetical protein
VQQKCEEGLVFSFKCNARDEVGGEMRTHGRAPRQDATQVAGAEPVEYAGSVAASVRAVAGSALYQRAPNQGLLERVAAADRCETAVYVFRRTCSGVGHLTSWPFPAQSELSAQRPPSAEPPP